MSMEEMNEMRKLHSIPVSLRVRASSQLLALLLVSLFLGFTVGCHRDPNVQKQRYPRAAVLAHAKEGKYKEAGIQFANALKVDLA